MAKASGSIRDVYSNKAFGEVVESAANTLTFKEIQTNVSIFDKAAWIIHRIEWYLDNTALGLLGASDDKIEVALTASNAITTLALSNASVIDKFEVGIRYVSAAGFAYKALPDSRDFSALPGGGLIIAPRPLFIAVKGTSIASAVTASMRFYFTQIELAADSYLELIDFYRIVQ